MNLLYCGDGNIADGVILSVLSIQDCVSEPISVFILTAGLKTATREFKPLAPRFEAELNSLLKEKSSESKARVIDITELFNSLPPTANLETRFTPLCMLRLYADLVPEIPDRVLYLDNDVICRKDFSSFYYQDISDFELCGVLDHYGKWFFKSKPLRLRPDYLNSGVLLLNLKKIKETELFKKCRKSCSEVKMFMPDQSAINKLSKKKKLCHRRYNEQRKLKSSTVFRHFTTSFRLFPWLHSVTVKPWDIDRVHSVLKTNEYDGLFERYEELLPKFKEDYNENK